MTHRRVLALGAHPDDVEIYCLGTLLRLKGAGWQIGWVVVTDGQAGLPDGAVTGTRRKEALAAAGRVDVSPVLLGWEDGGLHDGPDAVRALRAVVADFAPTLLIAPSLHDYHPDHRALARLASAVCPLSAALWRTDTMLGVGFLPEFAVDITETYALKIECLKEHRSQLSSGALEAIGTWNRFRGLQLARPGVRQAEAFRADAAFGRPLPHEWLAELQQAVVPQGAAG